jgi:hypothetical protein
MKPTKCCSGTACRSTSANPKNEGWNYQSDLAGIGQGHRNGWWCQECTRKLKDHLDEMVASGEASLDRVERLH